MVYVVHTCLNNRIILTMTNFLNCPPCPPISYVPDYYNYRSLPSPTDLGWPTFCFVRMGGIFQTGCDNHSTVEQPHRGWLGHCTSLLCSIYGGARAEHSIGPNISEVVLLEKHICNLRNSSWLLVHIIFNNENWKRTSKTSFHVGTISRRVSKAIFLKIPLPLNKHKIWKISFAFWATEFPKKCFWDFLIFK